MRRTPISEKIERLFRDTRAEIMMIIVRFHNNLKQLETELNLNGGKT